MAPHPRLRGAARSGRSSRHANSAAPAPAAYTPSMSRNVPRATIVRMGRRFVESSTGATQASMPAKCATHSSRVRSRSTAAISSCVAARAAPAPCNRRDELRLDRAEREELAVGAGVAGRRSDRRRRADWRRARRSTCPPPAGRKSSRRSARRRRSSPRRSPALAAALDRQQRGDHRKRQHHAAAGDSRRRG